LVCDLAEWHLVDGPRRRYHLRGLEWVSTSEAAVVRPVANGQDTRRRTSRTDRVPPGKSLGGPKLA
jgi:hypothetical protein